MWDVRKLKDVSRKSKLVGRHEDGKSMPPQKNYQIKTSPDNATEKFWSKRQD